MRIAGLRLRSKASLLDVRAGRGGVEHDVDVVEDAAGAAGLRRLRAVVATPMRCGARQAVGGGSMPTIAPISMCRPWRRILIIRSVPMLPLPMMAALSLRGHGWFLASDVMRVHPARLQAARSVPHAAHAADRGDDRSPGATGTIGPSAPVMITSPALSGLPSAANLRASQSAALSGWPRHAAPVPTETTSPRRSIAMPHSCRSTWLSLRGSAPSAYETAARRCRRPCRAAGCSSSRCGCRRSRWPAAHRPRRDDQPATAWCRRPAGRASARSRPRLRPWAASCGRAALPRRRPVHVGEQHAEVGLVDAQLALHGLRGQADLAADQAPALGRGGSSVLASWIW